MSKKELPERKNIPMELTWDLTLIYPNSDAWEKDFAELDERVAAFNAYRGRLAESAAVLRDAIAALDNMERLLEKLYTYAHLKHDEDTAEPQAKTLENRASGKAAAISAECAWFEPELLAVDDEKISAMLQEDVLKFYKPSIEELLRAKKHTLSEKEERIMGALSDVLSAP